MFLAGFCAGIGVCTIIYIIVQSNKQLNSHKGLNVPEQSRIPPMPEKYRK